MTSQSLEDHHVLKFPRIKLAALGALVFGVAMSFGAFAWENNGPCWSCHSACDAARVACVSSGGGSVCFQQYRACQRSCGCPIP